MVLNYCGRGSVPGTTPIGTTGGSNPRILIPVIVIQGDPPFTPSDPKPPQPFGRGGGPTGPGDPDLVKWKCVDTFTTQPTLPPPGQEWVEPNNYKRCAPCNSAVDPIWGVNPAPKSPGCVHVSKTECESKCTNKTRPIGSTGSGSADPPIGSVGGSTGVIQKYKCVAHFVQQCIETANTPFSWENFTAGITTASNINYTCEQCTDTYLNANNEVVPDLQCIYNSKAQCEANCVSPLNIGQCLDPVAPTVNVYLNPNTGIPLPTVNPLGSVGGGGSVTTGSTNPSISVTTSNNTTTTGSTNPSISVTTSNNTTTTGNGEPPISPQSLSQSVTLPQPNNNVNIVSVQEVMENEDRSEISQGVSRPKLYDPELNFFTMSPAPVSQTVVQYGNSNVFKSIVAVEIANLLQSSQSNLSWNELDLQSITDERLITSLNPRLLTAFQNLRYPGGERVGLSSFLEVVRRHLLEGTISELDSQFFINTYQNQKSEQITMFDNSEYEEYSERFAINFLKNKEYTYENTTKGSEGGNIQIGRMRPLNEDLNMSVNIEKLDSTVLTLDVANDGIPINYLSPSSQITPISVGSPDRLNIGNGWGFYFQSNQLNGTGVAVDTNNIIGMSYFASPPARAKALGLLHVDTSIKITSKSLPNKNEFIAGDTGPSAIRPLYFGLNLNSVVGEATEDNPLIEQYSATYSLISDSDSIAIHLNNNALNLPMVSLDYRDPLYRYILDTSSLSTIQKDYTLEGFRDKAFSGVEARFVRNIPYGFVITPVVGSKYNPFNSKSTLDSFGDVNTRSISVRPALTDTIDGFENPLFNSYNLYNTNGSKRIGLKEIESFENIGYTYDPDKFSYTFFSDGLYGVSSQPASSYGASYLSKDVLDYISQTYNTSSITWYDIFSRMPVNRVGELFYEGVQEYLYQLSRGYRNSTTIDNVEISPLNSDRILPDDSKTIIRRSDRLNLTSFEL